jgi:hypothetical protein
MMRQDTSSSQKYNNLDFLDFMSLLGGVGGE